MKHTVRRRTFIMSLAGAGGTFLTTDFSLAANRLAAESMPKRLFGSAQDPVSILGLGTAVMGCLEDGENEGIQIVHTALDQGVNYIDTGRIYGIAESCIGKVARDRREEMFLVTKVWANTAKEAEQQLTTSLKTLETDHVDLCHIHSMGHRDPQQVLADDGALSYLVKAKKKGLTRCIGASGHHKIANLLSVLETGEIDAVMTNLNFVDRSIYNYYQRVFPLAQKHKMTIIAMKVFGGPFGVKEANFLDAYRRQEGPQMPKDLLRDSIHYCLSLGGVTTALAGVRNREELLEDVRLAKDFQPLTAKKKSELETKGEEIAPSWGPRFGSP
ncbi:MAG: aldo/keto reductase [Candidatus Omnitrophica bacterium]|nr:aldo/keto reductase [Candidatus Omnitrophota bacterium]